METLDFGSLLRRGIIKLELRARYSYCEECGSNRNRVVDYHWETPIVMFSVPRPILECRRCKFKTIRI